MTSSSPVVSIKNPLTYQHTEHKRKQWLRARSISFSNLVFVFIVFKQTWKQRVNLSGWWLGAKIFNTRNWQMILLQQPAYFMNRQTRTRTTTWLPTPRKESGQAPVAESSMVSSRRKWNCNQMPRKTDDFVRETGCYTDRRFKNLRD